MAHDPLHFLSQTCADLARYAATLAAQLEAAQDELVKVTAQRDALNVKPEPPPA